MGFNVADIHTLILCAVRYALGRKTYIVYDVAEIVKKNPSELRDDTLILLDRDIRRELERGNYGMQCDLEIWQALRQTIQKEQAERAGI